MSEKLTTCQICARPVKAKSGIIAHHGYRRPNRGSGWQTASCRGARHLPYEVSCDALPPTIELIKMHIMQQQERLKDHIRNPPEKLTINMGFYSKSIEVTRPAGFDPHKRTGCYPAFSYDGQFDHVKREIELSIRLSKIDLQFMEKRLVNWIPPKVNIRKIL